VFFLPFRLFFLRLVYVKVLLVYLSKGTYLSLRGWQIGTGAALVHSLVRVVVVQSRMLHSSQDFALKYLKWQILLQIIRGSL